MTSTSYAGRRYAHGTLWSGLPELLPAPEPRKRRAKQLLAV